MGRRSDHTRAQLRNMALRAARNLVNEKGVAGLSGRQIANRIGYTIGTLYLVFKNIDDLVEQMNARTLKRLYRKCTSVPDSDNVRTRLNNLAGAFISFAEENEAAWNAVFSYAYQPGHTMSEEYVSTVERLISLLMQATQELYTNQGPEEQASEIRLLWVSLYGIFSLHSTNRLHHDYPMPRLTATLLDIYLAGRMAKAGIPAD